MTWSTVPLRRVVDCLDGRRIPLNAEQRASLHGEVPYWGANGVLDRVYGSLFNEPLVLLGEDGAPFFEVGKSVAFYVEGPIWPNNHIHVLRPRAIEPRFLAYCLNSVDYGSYITGSTRDKLTQEDLLRIVIPYPTWPEQRRIADFLDAEIRRICRIVELRQTQDALTQDRLQAIRDGRVAALYEKYGSVPLRRLMRSIEQGSSPQCDAVPAADEEWGVLKLSSVKSGRFIPGENKRLPEGELGQTASSNVVHVGDVLVTRANTPALVGDVAVVDVGGRFLLPDLIYRVNLGADADARYIAQVALCTRVRSLVSAQARGSSQSMVKLRGEDIREWPIPPAPIAEQLSFMDQIEQAGSRVAALRSALARQISVLTERRQALITAAVTGQMDVTTARGVGVS
ncbi:hypothetical protein E0H73_35355 [Kribbella pittospori]|uniref:Type I restriction modification DNA specificity domain-containing protein n=1 Tax=Kribbella pittospori TaxID=722689 RepID=A0A4R0K8J1_9ACTN|nr:restriction endonuclease subunit S [Kribbella pittospori]TCC55989.1 hypothetical protein E0H73_35355 [Kribbella pittospori]